ncbi:hypothetical protein BC830DRAFT_1223733, partial [Chytriomyces sp. MP71]
MASTTSRYAPGLNNQHTDPTTPYAPSIPLLPSPTTAKYSGFSKTTTTGDLDSLASMIQNMTTDAASSVPPLAPFSTPINSTSNSHFNLDDAMGDFSINTNHATHSPLKKYGSQSECVAKSLSTLSLMDASSSNGTLTPTRNMPAALQPLPSKPAMATAIEVIKLSMMGLSMSDEEEVVEGDVEEYAAEWEKFVARNSTSSRNRRPQSASPTRRHLGHYRSPYSANYRYDATDIHELQYVGSVDGSMARFLDRLKDGKKAGVAWSVPRHVCMIGNALPDEGDARSRRRHPYYRPPAVSPTSLSRKTQDAATATIFSDLSHALWMRER